MTEPMTYKTVDLLQAKEALEEANQHFFSCVAQSQGELCLPPAYDDAENRYERAAQSMTRLYKQSKKDMAEETQTVPVSGALCADAGLLEAAQSLNKHKAHFETVAINMRDTLPKNAFEDAVRSTGVNDIDRNAAYGKITILPADTTSISWIWAGKHRAVESVTRDQALAMVDKLSTEASRDVARALLTPLKPSDRLAIPRKRSGHMRANIQFVEGGVLQNDQLTASRVFLAQQERLPEYCEFRSPNQSLPRKQRTDMRVSATPFISGLNLYQYVATGGKSA